ncbi:ATP-dependent zinc metalloprotease FtsH [bacterium]|nr:ATP-dependent zinc metalloprotease FtsH [bacterium]
MPEEPKKPKNFTALIVWGVVIALLLLVIGTYENVNFTEQEIEIAFPKYRELLENRIIKKATILNNEFHGELKQKYHFPATSEAGKIKTYETRLVRVIFPSKNFMTSEVLKEWNDYGVDYSFKDENNTFLDYFLSYLPMVLILVLFLFFMRRFQGGNAPKGLFNFGKSRAKAQKESDKKTTFADVAGADEAKMELQEVVEFLKEPKKFQKLGAKIPKGVLLLGPPGTGKTLLAKAVAGEAGVPFFSMSGADFVEMFVGVGASRVRDLFEQGKKNAPCIIFIDEIDAVGRHRGAGLGGGHDEREQTLNQLLVEMDGFEENANIILIGATNRPDVLDKALLRPGRFDRQIIVDLPDKRGREGILKVHTKKIPLAENVALSTVAQGTPGLSGADLANVVNEAAILASRKNAQVVTMDDFEEAKDKIMLGVPRKSFLMSEKEKEITAYHEAGHVLTGMLTPDSDPIHKVTIVPRGRALGITHFLPLDDRRSYSKSYCESRLITLLGGRCAEKIIFKHLTTGAGNDLEVATNLVRKMVCEWGMSEVIGPITCGKQQEEIFLGREIAQHRDYSEQTAQVIDAEVRKIITTAERKAEELLRKNINKLHEISTALIQHETLDSSEIEAILGNLISTNYQKNNQTKVKPLQKTFEKTEQKEDTFKKSKTQEAIEKNVDENSTPQNTQKDENLKETRKTFQRKRYKPKREDRQNPSNVKPLQNASENQQNEKKEPQKHVAAQVQVKQSDQKISEVRPQKVTFKRDTEQRNPQTEE